MVKRGARESVRKARAGLYRSILLEGAERVFAEVGYEDAKMESIARESGLSLGTLYSVFRGKWELFRAIHDARGREVLDLASAVAQTRETVVERLLAGVRVTAEFFMAHPDYLRMHLREGYAWSQSGVSTPSREQEDAWRKGVAMQATNFRCGVEEGVFYPGDPMRMARMMIAMHQVQLADWMESGRTRSTEEVIAEMQDQVRRSFCRSDADPAGAA